MMESFAESSILVVDHSRPFLMSAGKMLNSGGYANLHFAFSPAEAFALLGMDGPSAHDAIDVDLILMAAALPDGGGIEACRRLRAEPRLGHVPIVMMIEGDEVARLADALAAGADDYLAKPFSEVEILARLRTVLRWAHQVCRCRAREREVVELAGQLERAQQSLARLNRTDVLTGLGNRRHLELVMEEEWRRGMREALPLALICIDIDDFKGYNAAMGYPQGDEALRRLAGAYGSVLRRAGDVAVRYSGEEFAVLLPNTDLEGALAVAAELRERTVHQAIGYDNGPDGLLSACLGVAVAVPLPGTSHHALLAAADEALVMAKEAGSGQIQVAAAS